METTVEQVFINLKIQDVMRLQRASMIWMDLYGNGDGWK
jgi:hypothetical protein